jgi:hypothetical protein
MFWLTTPPATIHGLPQVFNRFTQDVAIIVTLPVKAFFRRVLSNQRVRFSLYFSAQVQGTQDLVSSEICEARSLPLAQILGCIAPESHWLSMLDSGSVVDFKFRSMVIRVYARSCCNATLMRADQPLDIQSPFSS